MLIWRENRLVGQKLGAPVEACIPALVNQPPGVIVLVTGRALMTG